MADPSDYDLVQDARLDAHEALITPQPRQRPAAQYSFPIVGQDISDDEFMQMMIATPSGIADEGGQPFWLRQLDDATRTAQLTVSKTTGDGKAALAGSFYRLLQDVTIPLPMPATSTRYHVCLTYDPLGHSRPEGPISVQTYAGEPPTSGGRRHIVLWVVPCEPSQLLSDVKPIQVRPKAAPQLTVDTAEQLPSPQSVLWGTTCIITHGIDRGREFIAWGASEETGGPTEWVPVNGLVWRDLNLAGTRRYPGHGLRPQYAVTPQGVAFRGRVARDSGDFTTSSDGWTLGWVNTVYGDRPFTVFQPVAGSGTTSPSLGKVTIDGGTLLLFPQQTMSWVDLGGVVGYWT